LLALTIAFLFGLGAEAVAQSETVPCESLEIEVRLNPTQEPECLRGWTSEGDFRGTWEFVSLFSGERAVLASLERAGTHSVFYRPTLESAVEDILWSDVIDIEWSTGVNDPKFKARRFVATLDTGALLPCVGFLETRRGGSMGGSEVKSVLYGTICSLNEVAFDDGEVADMLGRMGY